MLQRLSLVLGLGLILALAPSVHAETAATEAPEAESAAAIEAVSVRLRPDRVYLTFGSKHLNIDPAAFGRVAWNEVNPGVILTWEDRGRLGLNYSLGVFQNSYADLSAYAGFGKTWPIGESGLRLGWVLGVADYGANARLIRSQIGTSGWIVTGGAQVEYRNVFVQIQPAGPQGGGGQGAVIVGGLSFPFGR